MNIDGLLSSLLNSPIGTKAFAAAGFPPATELRRGEAMPTGPLMLGVVVFGHGANGFFFNNANGGWEYPLFWTVALVAQALLGAGAYSLDNRN